MTGKAGILTVDHTGFSVSSLDEAIQFWTQAMGFELVRESEMGGDFLRRTTGVDDRCCRMALVKGPGGYHIELLEYSTARSLGRVPESAGGIGASHLAVTVSDIEKAIACVEAAGWTAKGSVERIPAGPREGTRVAYVCGPDGITIELMQP